jgi:hypothetical protein
VPFPLAFGAENQRQCSSESQLIVDDEDLHVTWPARARAQLVV